MARTDYGAILSTVIKNTSDSIREVNETSALIAPNEWGGLIRAMHSDSEYQSALAGLQKNTIENVPIASFNALSGVKLDSLKVLVEAQQDLHGYDKPWAGGGGKNKLNESLLIEQIGWNIIELTLKPNTTYTMSSNIPSAKTSELPVYFVNENANPGSSTLVYSGHSVTITTLSTGYLKIQQRRVSGEDSFQNYQWQIEEGSTATSFEPYENICPITGWSGANVTRTGKNLFGNKPFSNWVSVGSYKALKNILPNNQSMIMSFSDNDNTVDVSGIYFGFLSSSWSGTGGTAPALSDYRWVISNGVIGANKTNTSVSGGNLLNSVFIYPNTEAAYNKLFARYNIQVEFGSTATAYKPYNGNTYTISFGDTCYGGELDVTNGVLRVTHGFKVCNGSENWDKHGSIASWFFCDNLLTNAYTNNSENDFVISNMGVQSKYSNVISMTNSYFALGENNRFVFKNTSYTTIEDFEDWLSNNNLQICYELATPFTIQLTPQQIEQLEENNIGADTGDVSECKYYASGSEPQYDITQICDNSSYSSTLTLTDSYSNYDFLKIVIYNSDDSKEYTIFTIPSVLDQIATYGNNLVNFNTVMETNIYCAYTMTSSSTWTRYGNRNSNIKAIYGYKATNKTVSVTPIYARQNITTSSVTPTSTTSLYDYDIIFLATCSGAVDETQPCNNVIYPKGKFNGIPHYFILNKYLGATCVAMTEFTLGANSNYFGVYGVKFT